MSVRRQIHPRPSSDFISTEEHRKGKNTLRDEEKSKEQLIEELFELRERIAELEDAQEKSRKFVQGEIHFGLPGRIAAAKALTGVIPICTCCKKIRDDGGYWTQLEIYIRDHSDAEFSHGLCPECVKKFYPVDILTKANQNSQPGDR